MPGAWEGLLPAVYSIWRGHQKFVCKMKVRCVSLKCVHVCVLGSEESRYTHFQAGLSTQRVILRKMDHVLVTFASHKTELITALLYTVHQSIRKSYMVTWPWVWCILEMPVTDS